MYVIICSTCRKRAEFRRKEDARYRPFCCKRCQAIDLGRWLCEDYRVIDPLHPDDVDESEPSTPET